MCLVCIQWELGKLTNEEARRNVGEFINVGTETKEELEHYLELVRKLQEDEQA